MFKRYFNLFLVYLNIKMGNLCGGESDGSSRKDNNSKSGHQFQRDDFVGIIKRNPLNDYKIVQGGDLGEGAYGSVRVVEDKKLANRLLALKEMDAPQDKDDFENLNSEFQLITQCKHPNIIKMVDMYQHKDHVYFVEEYIPNTRNLNCIIEMNVNKKSNIQLAYIVENILRTFKYMHDQGIVHRDFKAENCLINLSPGQDINISELQIKLIDFGFARVLKGHQKFSDFKGTPLYMAPEIVMKQ